MKTFKIVWEIELDADTPEEAARLALEIQRDPASVATLFDVHNLDENTFDLVDLSPDLV